jgi:hypothetical protein
MSDFAREQAKLYLKRSIDTLQAILGIDAYDLTKIPVGHESPMYDAYFCLLNEVNAYKRLEYNEI